MNRKWWKFLLPIPFIFFYCYCVSFPNKKEKDVGRSCETLQQEAQVSEEQQKAVRTTEPPPPSPTEEDSPIPPAITAESVDPIPQGPQSTHTETLSVEPGISQVKQADAAPQKSTSESSTPPPARSASSAVAQESSSAPVVPLPAPSPAPQRTKEEQDVIIALVTLSASENEKADEKSHQLSANGGAQELSPAVDAATQKKQHNEYVRSTTKVSVSQETFEADKKHILNMINDLDRCMETGDYKGWRNCLSEESRNYWSKPQNLRKAAAKLPISGIKLNNMQDYFNYVFIPARKGRKVEEIRYVTETQVKAVQVEDNVDMVFYHFKKVDGKWRLFLPQIKD